MLEYIGIGAVLLIAVLCVEIYRELHSFRVVTYRIQSEKLKDMDGKKRIVFLSDLHNQVYGKDNIRLIKSIEEAGPDLVLIGGDMLVGKEREPYLAALSFVKELAGRFPVYYANGNHEQRMKECPEGYRYSYEEYKKELEQAGVYFLENESAEVTLGRCRTALTGLEIPRQCYSHFRKQHLPEEVIKERIGESEKDAYQILLAHNPAYMEEYISWGADLILSGHLHGGIVRIPGVAGVISPAFVLFPKYSGDHYREGDTDIVVSKGLGVHTICVRLFNPAELIVLELLPVTGNITENISENCLRK